MYIVSFTEPVFSQFSKSSGVHLVAFEPFKPYVISNQQYSQYINNPEQKSLIYRASLLESRLSNFHATCDEKEKDKPAVLFWTGAGGFGDQILAWPVAHLIHLMGFKVHVMVDPGHLMCWWGFPWVRMIFQFPIYLEQVMLYKRHALFEVVTNADEHPDQLHPVDSMLTRLGLDPAAVDSELKTMRPAFTAGELARAQGQLGGKPLGIYQLSATGKTRSFSPEQSALNLKALSQAFPDIFWLAVYDNTTDGAYRLKAELCGGDNVRPAFFQNIRELWALASQASVVVSPDSMMVHVAGSMNVPCVGLWGTVDPKTRVKFYKNHIALWKSERCFAAPCFQHYNSFPGYCPSKEQQCCNVLAGIAPEEIVNAVKTLLG